MMRNNNNNEPPQPQLRTKHPGAQKPAGEAEVTRWAEVTSRHATDRSMGDAGPISAHACAAVRC
jgi:hypothetical protein